LAIPVIITAWLLVLSYRFILFVGEPVINLACRGLNLALGRTEEAGNLIEPAGWFVNTFGILTPILIFIALGVMAANVLGAKVIHLFERLLLKFPIISYVYSGLKQMMDSFRSFGGARSFKRVVYVEYPAPGCRLLGFVTGQYFDQVAGCEMTHIFIPTAPNPMTGFVIVADSDHVIETSLSIEQATKIILSAGLVTPDAPSAPAVTPDTDGKPARAGLAVSRKAHSSPPSGRDPVSRHEHGPVYTKANAATVEGRTGYEDDQA
ncbi:MAG: DUF502 domain-containing protein, partial [Verrucomicrobiae bacterium]|nr:DUF502 domain-containing protein [Verrucomicrobiae bacterium]